jgi:uncharacterized protein (TIGR04255 family)
MLKAEYPKHDRQLLQEHRVEAKPDGSATSFSSRHTVQALRFHEAEGKQLVQVRALGYSFNRLAPYTALDDYLPEIERVGANPPNDSGSSACPQLAIARFMVRRS